MATQDIEDSWESDIEDLWNRYMGERPSWEEYGDSSWDMERLLGDLRARGLTGQELIEVAREIAEELEAGGYFMTSAETVTLTTEHAASRDGVPVLVINGKAFGPADMTPAGMSGAELVNEWAARFAGLKQSSREAEIEEVLCEIWDQRQSWSKRTRNYFLVTIGEATCNRIRRALGKTEGRGRDDETLPRRHRTDGFDDDGPDAPFRSAADMPLALAVVRVALRHGLPATCRVSGEWRDADGNRMINVVDETNQVLSHVAVFDPDFTEINGAGTKMKKKPKTPDYHATMASVWGGGLVMYCEDEDDARPWVRLLTGAGLALEHLPPAGRYSFTFDGRPDLTEEAEPNPGAALGTRGEG